MAIEAMEIVQSIGILGKYKGAIIRIKTTFTEELDDVHYWLEANLGPKIDKRWSSWSTNIEAQLYITNEDDLMLFKLRWQ